MVQAELTAVVRSGPGPGIFIDRRVLALLITPDQLRRARVRYRSDDELYRGLFSLSVLLSGLTTSPGAVVSQSLETLTTAEFAAAAHIGPEAVRQACRQRRIEAVKRNGDWQIGRSELVRWLTAR
jgi:hypothetical protein